MGVITRVKLFENSVDTTKIAADTIIPADIDETRAYNFTNTSSTFGKLPGGLEIDAITITNAAAGANNFSFNITFSSPPVCVATRVTTSTAQYAVAFDSVTTTGGTLYTDTAGTYYIIAVNRP